MKLHFEENLPHQLAAIEAVCDLFRGQEVCRTEFTVTQRAASKQMGLALEQGMEESALGIGNRLTLLDDELRANLIAKLRAFRNVAGPQVPTPILAASAACWSDENHVAANRAAYQEKMAAAERILGNRVKRPGGGFFLWLNVGDGEKAAHGLWREEGIRVLPGAYMGRENDLLDGRAGDGSLRSPAGRSQEKLQSNPGFSYVRIALVNDLSTILTALERVRNFLDRA